MTMPAPDKAIARFVADRLAERGEPTPAVDPLVAAAYHVLALHGDLLHYRDHGILSERDAAWIDGLSLAVRLLAARWKDHNDYHPDWAPAVTDSHDLLEGGPR